MNQPKRHHYISVMVLKHFTDGDGRLWLCRQAAEEPKFWCTRPENAFLERNLYTLPGGGGNADISVESELSRIESNASTAIDRIVSCSLAGHCPSPTAEERTRLIRFIIHQQRRTPETHGSVDGTMDGWLAETPERFRNRAGRAPTDDELARFESQQFRTMARQVVIANVAGAPPTAENLQRYAQCPIEFAVIRPEGESFVIGSFIYAFNWFPIHSRVALRLVHGSGGDRLTVFRDMAEVRRINRQTAGDSTMFAGSSEQLVRSLVRTR